MINPCVIDAVRVAKTEKGPDGKTSFVTTKGKVFIQDEFSTTFRASAIEDAYLIQDLSSLYLSSVGASVRVKKK